MTKRQSVAPLRLKAFYSVGELAAAAGVDRRQLRQMLEAAGVELVKMDRGYVVSLVDLEFKVRPLWEGIKVVQTFVRGLG